MFEHNVMKAASGSIFNRTISAGNLVSDYNNLLRSGGALIARQAKSFGADDVYPTLTEWQLATGDDAHSLSHDSGFADSAGGDFHLLSLDGRFTCSGLETNGPSSDLLDAGNPDAPFSFEPESNGSRVNIGLYGNTTEASLSTTNPRLLAVSFNDGGIIDALAFPTVTLYWVHTGFTNGAVVDVSIFGQWGRVLVHHQSATAGNQCSVYLAP